MEINDQSRSTVARRPPIGPNHGERLYQKGMRKKEQREAVLREARSE